MTKYDTQRNKQVTVGVKEAMHKGSSLHSMVPDDRKIWIVSGHLIMPLHYEFHYFSLLVMSLEGQKSVVKNLLKVILWSLSIKYNVNFLRPCLCLCRGREALDRQRNYLSQPGEIQLMQGCLLALSICSGFSTV